ncbi:hypothetical protein SUGI_0131890 [Cryptomeria japonica]|uniref:uncharacterized protein LOC131873619 n=1 Tax=Cryptomeria japonica TaxID=3369 RepID=UPI002408F200|nr:uncharacterized protein LOC131873619 [Cryptomeria japonica]GLJ10618.1 hypothetical protein SUGI_0131890 [Cryptomeria japonica]
MDAGIHSLSSVLQDYALRIPVEWLVSLLLLTSMMLQLVLVVLGARRYKSSIGFYRFVVWGAYISADAVAISALGTMMHNARNGIYGIWAPVLLLHLGGPDAITAYSMADNELWLRHGFTMVYQVSVATYVVYSSALQDVSALASAILLLVAGATKYGERTLAFWFASYSQIVKSCLPISKYIKESSYVHRHGYFIMGEEQLQEMIEKASTSEARQKAPSLEGRGIVTILDVQSANIEGKDYNLCFSHALFKMYKRRFVNLYFDEGEWKRTRTVWFAFTGKEAFGIVEMELKFLHDAFFSKWSGTTSGKWGLLVRLLNTTLMGAVGFLILREREYREPQRTVTYVVISVALVVELFQLCQMMISNWTRVHLICARVDKIKRPHSQSAVKWCRICRLKVIEIALLVLGKVRKVVRGDRYQSNRIQQHCLLQAWLNRPPLMWKKVGLKADNFIVSGYIKLRHIHKVSVQEELNDFIFNILKVRCSVQNDSEACRDRIYNFEEDLFAEETEIINLWLLNGNLQEVILIWHIAATICDSRRESSEQNENNYLHLIRILSRYCSYLLLSHPNLLPLHPDMARIAYVQVVEQLTSKEYIGKDPRDLINCKGEGIVGKAAGLARFLMGKQEEERWKLLADYWGGLVIYMAVYNKAPFHAECVGGGGEFLSQVWVLLGHMGCGEQSDSAVGKKIERSAEGERRERNERRERRRIERRRVEQEQERRKRRRMEQEQESKEEDQERKEQGSIEEEQQRKRRESLEFLEQERMHR